MTVSSSFSFIWVVREEKTLSPSERQCCAVCQACQGAESAWAVCAGTPDGCSNTASVKTGKSGFARHCCLSLSVKYSLQEQLFE